MQELHKDLKALGVSASNNKDSYKFDRPDKTLLETFPCPKGNPNSRMAIKITTKEFSSLCPKTGAPDFATIVINYFPRERCIESKSIKLFFLGFRNHGAFHEQCVQEIADALIEVLDPEYLSVEGRFTPRGGIPFWPEVIYRRPESPDEFHGIPALQNENQ